MRIPERQVAVSKQIKTKLPPGKKLKGQVRVFVSDDLCRVEQGIVEYQQR